MTSIIEAKKSKYSRIDKIILLINAPEFLLVENI
jgi:hypothetical protein